MDTHHAQAIAPDTTTFPCTRAGGAGGQEGRDQPRARTRYEGILSVEQSRSSVGGLQTRVIPAPAMASMSGSNPDPLSLVKASGDYAWVEHMEASMAHRGESPNHGTASITNSVSRSRSGTSLMLSACGVTNRCSSSSDSGS